MIATNYRGITVWDDPDAGGIIMSPPGGLVVRVNPRRSLDWLRWVPARDRYRRQTGNHAQWVRRHEMWGGR
jgi:hypothetical protein